MTPKPMNADQVAAANDHVRTAVRHRVVNIGGNPDGHVVLALEDGSLVAMTQPMIDLIALVNREGLAQGAAAKAGG